VDFTLSGDQQQLAANVRELCQDFPEEYWNQRDAERAYPQEFVEAITAAGYLSLLIPSEYGGGGGSLTDAAVVLEEVNRCGGSALSAHAQMYTMSTILRHGSEEQKKRWLPAIAAGELRLQSLALTEADAGSDISRISTTATRVGDHYLLNGHKMWTSRVQHTDLMLVVARTTPREAARKPTDGLSVFVVDLREVPAGTLDVEPIATMVSSETNALEFRNLPVPADCLIGEENRGFGYVLSSMNAERVLISSEIVGDGHWLLGKAAAYVSQREVFGRAIGSNQAVAFPLAQAYAQLEAASLMRFKAAALFDQGLQPGVEANIAKLLSSQATWEAANAAMTAFGGLGLADAQGIHRKFREARFLLVAPVSNNLVLSYLSTQALNLPRSY
jgi:acyl-CoA dehydrogenase